MGGLKGLNLDELDGRMNQDQDSQDERMTRSWAALLTHCERSYSAPYTV
jgi:hypothetical protein